MTTNQTQSQETMSQAFRSAVALNNIGVSFLERQDYKQAVTTFADAVQAMKCSFYNDGRVARYGSDHDYSHKLQDQLQTASKKISCVKSKHNCGPVEVHSCDDDNFKSIKIIVQHDPSSTVIFPLRIRLNGELSLEDNSMSVHFATILRNYGLSLSCLARVINTNAKSASLKLKATKAFRLGLSVVRRRISSSTIASIDFDALLISAMLLKDLNQALCDLELPCEALLVRQRLTGLLVILEETGALEDFNQSSQTAAATA